MVFLFKRSLPHFLTFILLTGASLIEFDCSVTLPLETAARGPAVIEIYNSLTFGDTAVQGSWDSKQLRNSTQYVVS